MAQQRYCLPAPRLATVTGGSYGVGDNPSHGAYEACYPAALDKADQVDDRDAEAPAQLKEIQKKYKDDARSRPGDDEALQGEQSQPPRRLPSSPASAADNLCGL